MSSDESDSSKPPPRPSTPPTGGAGRGRGAGKVMAKPVPSLGARRDRVSMEEDDVEEGATMAADVQQQQPVSPVASPRRQWQTVRTTDKSRPKGPDFTNAVASSPKLSHASPKLSHAPNTAGSRVSLVELDDDFARDSGPSQSPRQSNELSMARARARGNSDVSGSTEDPAISPRARPPPLSKTLSQSSLPPEGRSVLWKSSTKALPSSPTVAPAGQSLSGTSSPQLDERTSHGQMRNAPSSPKDERSPRHQRNVSSSASTALAAVPSTSGSSDDVPLQRRPSAAALPENRNRQASFNETWAVAKAGGYEGADANELTLVGGERVWVLRQNRDGTSHGRTESGEEGSFPTSAVDMVSSAKSGSQSARSASSAAPASATGGALSATKTSGNASAAAREEPKRGKTLKDKLAETMAVAKSKGEKAVAASKSVAAAAKTKTKEVGSKALQKGKVMIGKASGPKADDVKDTQSQTTAHHFVFEEWVANAEMTGFTNVLMDMVVRPYVKARIEQGQRQRAMQPVVLSVGLVEEVVVDPRAPLVDEELRKLCAHLAQSVGLEVDASTVDVMELRAMVGPFVTFLCNSSSARDGSGLGRHRQASHALLKCVSTLHADPVGPTKPCAVPRVAVLLCMMVLHNGGLYSPDVFRLAPDDAELDTLQAALDDGLSLRTCSCVTASYALLEWLKTQHVFQSHEACVAAAWDPVRTEELVVALPAAHRDLMVFLCAFFRLFRHFSSFHGLTQSAISSLLATALVADPSTDEGLRQSSNGGGGGGGGSNNNNGNDVCAEFIATMLTHLPAHALADSAVGCHVSVTSQQKSRKPAHGIVSSYDHEKRRYVVHIAGAGEFAVKESQMEWHRSGSLPVVPHMAAVLFAPFVPALVEPATGDRGNEPTPAQHLMKGYESPSDGASSGVVNPVTVMLFNDACALPLAMLQTLAADAQHRQSILATAKALTHVFLFHCKEDLLVSQIVAIVVGQEVAETPQLATLFRGNSTASRLLSAFVNAACRDVVQCVSAPLAALMIADAQHQATSDSRQSTVSGGSSGSGDGGSASGQSESGGASGDEAVDYEFVAQQAHVFLDAIVDCADRMPSAVCKALEMVGDLAGARFADEPNARTISVGGVVFLRFFCPALLSPQDYGLNVEGVVTPSVQRIVMLITSAITVIVNHTTFSSSKATAVLNDMFVNQRRNDVERFLDTLSQSPGDVVVAPASVTQEQCDAASAALLVTAELLRARE